MKVINTQSDFNSKLTVVYDCFIKALRKHLGSEIEVWDEHLPKIAELASKFQWVEDPELQQLALDFIHEAERDLRSCKILYRNNIYPHATYHFQQAVEKATKGYMWGVGFLKEGKKTRFHESPKLFLMMLEKAGLFALLSSLPETRLSSLMLKGKQILKQPNNPDMARWSYEEINEGLSTIDLYGDKFQSVVEETFDCVSTSLNIKGDNIAGGKAMLIRVLSCDVVLCALSIIMLPHEAYTRYPDKDVKPDEYTAELGVVKAIPRMMEYLKQALEGLKIIISEQSK